MKKVIEKAAFKMLCEVNRLRNEERGEVNLISILLIVIVTIGLVAIFKTQITALINSIFGRINKDASGI